MFFVVLADHLNELVEPRSEIVMRRPEAEAQKSGQMGRARALLARVHFEAFARDGDDLVLEHLVHECFASVDGLGEPKA